MEKENINNLISQIKASGQSKTIQKVSPVKVKKTEEVQFSFYLPKSLLKSVKQKALDDNKTIKEVIINALKTSLV